MITRFDKLQTELPHPKNPSPNSAAAVQELLGGKFGEMSTFMNYTYQSFNFRGTQRDAAVLRPHRQHRGRGVRPHRAGLLRDQPAAHRDHGAGRRPGGHAARLGCRRPEQLSLPRQRPAGLAHGLAGKFWTGANVFSSGNLKLDLLHNFFLECGARAGKIRVYETVDDPTARACVGFLLVRGGVHIVAYAKALEKLTGVDVGKLLPIPDISNKRFPEAASTRPEDCTGSCTSSAPRTTRARARSGTARTRRTGASSKCRSGAPEGFDPPDLDAEPQLTAPVGPDIDPEMFQDVADRLFPELAARSGNRLEEEGMLRRADRGKLRRAR